MYPKIYIGSKSSNGLIELEKANDSMYQVMFEVKAYCNDLCKNQ